MINKYMNIYHFLLLFDKYKRFKLIKDVKQYHSNIYNEKYFILLNNYYKLKLFQSFTIIIVKKMKT